MHLTQIQFPTELTLDGFTHGRAPTGRVPTVFADTVPISVEFELPLGEVVDWEQSMTVMHIVDASTMYDKKIVADQPPQPSE